MFCVAGGVVARQRARPWAKGRLVVVEDGQRQIRRRAGETGACDDDDRPVFPFHCRLGDARTHATTLVRRLRVIKVTCRGVGLSWSLETLEKWLGRAFSQEAGCALSQRVWTNACSGRCGSLPPFSLEAPVQGSLCDQLSQLFLQICDTATQNCATPSPRNTLIPTDAATFPSYRLPLTTLLAIPLYCRYGLGHV